MIEDLEKKGLLHSKEQHVKWPDQAGVVGHTELTKSAGVRERGDGELFGELFERYGVTKYLLDYV